MVLIRNRGNPEEPGYPLEDKDSSRRPGDIREEIESGAVAPGNKILVELVGNPVTGGQEKSGQAPVSGRNPLPGMQGPEEQEGETQVHKKVDNLVRTGEGKREGLGRGKGRQVKN
jgi:hypothetical protein